MNTKSENDKALMKAHKNIITLTKAIRGRNYLRVSNYVFDNMKTKII